MNLNLSSNDKNKLPHKLLLTNTQVSRLRKAFENNSSANVKLSKTQLSEIVQLRRVLDKILGPLPTTGLPLMKTVLKPLAKSVLISLRLTVIASARDAAIQKKIFGSDMTTLIITG